MTPTDYLPLKKVNCRVGLPVVRPAEHFDKKAAARSKIHAVTGVVAGEPEKREVTWYVPVKRDDTGVVDWIALSRLKVKAV